MTLEGEPDADPTPRRCPGWWPQGTDMGWEDFGCDRGLASGVQRREREEAPRAGEGLAGGEAPRLKGPVTCPRGSFRLLRLHVSAVRPGAPNAHGALCFGEAAVSGEKCGFPLAWQPGQRGWGGS